MLKFFSVFNDKMLQSVTAERDSLAHQVHNLKCDLRNIEAATFSASCVINWNAINAFSVERLLLDGIPVTNIGFFVPGENAPLEWHIYCDIEQHEKLYQDFMRYLVDSDDS